MKKRRLFAILAEKKKPVYDERISSIRRIENDAELNRVIEEVRDFVSYWIAQGRKVKLRVEGETESG